MSYIENKVLNSNEHVVLRVKKSAWSLVPVWIWGILGSILLFIPTLNALYKTITFKNIELVVTNRKVIEKYGIIQIHVDEMDLTKVENITYNVTFWGRILGYSNLVIQGANRNHVYFSGIKDGEEVRRQINRLIDELKGIN